MKNSKLEISPTSFHVPLLCYKKKNSNQAYFDYILKKKKKLRKKQKKPHTFFRKLEKWKKSPLHYYVNRARDQIKKKIIIQHALHPRAPLARHVAGPLFHTHPRLLVTRGRLLRGAPAYLISSPMLVSKTHLFTGTLPCDCRSVKKGF